MFLPASFGAQRPGGIPPPNSLSPLDLRIEAERIWTVFGRVTTIDGRPVGGAKVQVDIGPPDRKPQLLETNLLGEFKTQYTLEAKVYTKLRVELVASKAGYLEARESVEFTSTAKKTWEVPLVLRETAQDSNLLPLEDFVSSLAPRLRVSAAVGLVAESARKDYQRGAEEFLDRRSATRAVPFLARAVERQPDCMNCRLLLGLAHLKAGSWTSAEREFAEAGNLAKLEKAAFRHPELPLILGVLETWRREEKKAVGYFLQALEVRPADPLVLQELGRALVLQKDWENADHYLEKAIKAGASPEARLLRVRTLLEEGDPDEADAEMRAYLGTRKAQDLPPAARMVYLQLKERLELKAFGKSQSLVGQPLEELIKAMPELRGLEPAQSQENLPLILTKVGENVAAFFRSFPNTISLEEILMESLRRDGTVQGSATEKSDYLMLARPEKWGLGLTEYRTSHDGKAAKPPSLQGGSMRTAGFASTSLFFHPIYQPGASFRYLGRQVKDGQETLVITFAQQPEKAQMIGRFDVGGVSAPVLLQGIAWVDPTSFQVIRMRTELLKPLPKVRLVRQTTEVHYGEVRFKEIPSALWLPREVTVTVQWKGRVFRNSHRYSDFKLFNVETQEKRKQAALAPETTVKPN